MKRRKRMLDDLDSDIQEHIRHEIQDNIDRGMSPEDARTAALRKFGNVARVKQETREVWTVVSLERLLQDIRLSLRILRKTPTFTAVAIVTLALAIGANAMVFSVMNALILRPLNVPDAERLYQLFCGKDKAGNQSFPDYLDLRDRNRSFDDLVACDGAVVGLDTDANPSSAWAVLVTGNYFDGLRLQPYLGRLFHSSDEHGANSAPYIVLTHAYWHSHFHDDPGVVGRAVQVNKYPFTIVGVAPAEFRGTLSSACILLAQTVKQ